MRTFFALALLAAASMASAASDPPRTDAVAPTPLEAALEHPPVVLSAEQRIGRPRLPEARPLNTFEEMRVDDGTPALRFTQWSGILGVANRFDPMDSWDASGTPPRALRVRRIHFTIASDSPSGPMSWYVWEDNGGHKPDDAAVIAGPFNVTGTPGDNVIDLEAMGQDFWIDPPRMFQVGFSGITADTPRVMMDDGLPYVGGTGDFHASYRYNDTQLCPAVKWGLLALGDIGDGLGSRSPAYVIWLEVEMVDPPPAVPFEEITDQAGAGSRVAWADVDLDGFEDLLVDGRTLYRNNGDGTLTDVTSTSGIPSGHNSGVFGDYDNDGDPDLFLTSSRCEPCINPSSGPDRLLRNEGDGTFTDRLLDEYGDDRDAPLPQDYLPSESAAWGDFNNDGWLDLYVANFIDWDTLGTADLVCFEDRLWINDGPPAFTFTDATAASGIAGTALCGRGVAPGDFDGDGDLDIFVSNYTLTPDLLWQNTGLDERDLPILFDTAPQRGVEGTDQLNAGAYGHGIGADWGDIDRDGDLDLVVGNLAHSGWLCFSDITMLFESSGGSDPVYTDIAGPAGIRYNEVHSEASFADWDNDGWEDLFITHVYDGWRSQLYRHRGTVPAGYELVTDASGIYQRSGWGGAWSDYDRDGDLDLASRQFYRSAVSAQSANHWLQVALEGVRSNRAGVGARITITTATGIQVREIHGGRGVSTQDSAVAHFGLGPDDLVQEVRVRFQGGCEAVLQDVAADQRILVVEPACLLARFSAAPGPNARSFDGRAVCLGEAVDFQDASDGTPTDWRWDFDGDGVFDVTGDPAPTWTYGLPGLYQVTLEVTDGTETSRWTAGVLVADPAAPWLSDPGNVLRAVPGSRDAPAFTWAGAATPEDGEDFLLYRGDDPILQDSLLTPEGFQGTSFTDDAPPAATLLFYRLLERSPGGCIAPDPYRP